MEEQVAGLLERIRRKLDQQGLSAAEASRQAVGQQDMIRDIERKHTLPGPVRLRKLAQILGTTSDWLLTGEGDEVATVLSEVRAAPASQDVRRDWRGAEPELPPLPRRGSAIGGEFGEIDQHIELTELYLGEVFEWVARPPELAGDRAAYELQIVGDSMFPRFSPGDYVRVSPQAPVGIGDDVIVQLNGGRDDDRVAMVLIKRLVRRTSSGVMLRQFNPNVTFEVPAERIVTDARGRAAIHRVLSARF